MVKRIALLSASIVAVFALTACGSATDYPAEDITTPVKITKMKLENGKTIDCVYLASSGNAAVLDCDWNTPQ